MAFLLLIYCISLRELLFICDTNATLPQQDIVLRLPHFVEQRIVVGYNGIDDVRPITYGSKMALSTHYFGIFYNTKLRLAFHPFCLDDEINVRYTSFTENYCPVWGVMPHRCIDIKTARQLGINLNGVAPFKFLGKIFLYTSTIHYNEVVQRLYAFYCINTQSSAKRRFKYANIKAIIRFAVNNIFYNNFGFGLLNSSHKCNRPSHLRNYNPKFSKNIFFGCQIA